MDLTSEIATAAADLPPPSLKRRMACWLYEGMLLFGVIFIAGYLFSTLSQSRHGLSNRPGLQAFVVLVLAIYFTWFWHKGQTLAMKTWRIRVLDLNGAGLTQGLALKRFVLSWLWFAPPLALAWMLEMPVMPALASMGVWVVLWAGSSTMAPGGQFWHDVWAGTQLVHEPAPD
ncbi:MAG: RDD family protein [Betaproteobacteria bacterium]|nr:RDD family protein [Betaproteobacteria bacterium]